MKKTRNCTIILLFSFVLLTISCQEEERELIDPTLDNTIPQGSQLAQLMRGIVTHDGSFDDLVDGGNCYSINFPYTILRNGIDEIVIDQISDYDLLSESDIIQIQFPITITKDDHIEEMIESDSELEVLANSCELQDEDIECIDFVYPFRFATYNSSNNIINTVEVIHDAQVYGFMDDLDETTLVAINYPLRLLLSDGTSIEVTHNNELLSEILTFETSCDENDG
ncbi:hypothetical protein SAMN04487910_3758 [Aquimarina amphilecti]|uniref:DUF4382 domain-containing protein n=2 Tax=Aquimarina amphilecti TaxID=1038014 RepID=A0A1H7UJZ4_AQUAM|nr:hypothetical protein SAMN04487910_3758 [Aquimarina amphilecti]